MRSLITWLKNLDLAVKIAILVILVTAYKFNLISKFSKVFFPEKMNDENTAKKSTIPSWRSFNCDGFKNGKIRFTESNSLTCELLNEESGRVCLYTYGGILEDLKKVRDEALEKGFKLQVAYSHTPWVEYAVIFCGPKAEHGQDPNSSNRVKGCEVGAMLMNINEKNRRVTVRARQKILENLMKNHNFTSTGVGESSWVHQRSCYSGQVVGS